jgi:uncharacterized glyoxalase superfamily protein PhnB
MRPLRSLGRKSMKSLTPLLNVDDAARSVRFYCDKLGFEVSNRFESNGKLVWAHISRGPIQMMINASSERGARGPRAGATSYDDVVLYFSVEDVHSLHRDLSAKGCTPDPIERQDYGLDEFTLRDPDGYELGFGSPVNQSSDV